MMKTRFIPLSLLMVLLVSTLSAQQSMTLSFTAIDNTNYANLDSIKIMNITKDRDTMLVWSDTVLMLNLNVGLAEQEAGRAFRLEAFPNPVKRDAVIKAVVPESGVAYVKVTDIRGRLLFTKNYKLAAGTHEFSFTPGREPVYFVSFSQNGTTRHLKLINENPAKGNETIMNYKAYHHNNTVEKTTAAYNPFLFGLGDELLYVGYYGNAESAITDIPMESSTYTFQFATNIPCPGIPTVEYEGQIYHTVQIGSQCWLKENLNAGVMIPSTQISKDNGVLEKYCYQNNPANCDDYGAIYRWDEMMLYTTQPQAQGICPPGWHIPCDSEWKLLEAGTDSQYSYGDPLWNTTGYRGFNSGIQLKSTLGWNASGNGTDAFGFNGLPAGYMKPDNSFDYWTHGGYWWVSSEKNSQEAWYHDLRYNKDDVYRGTNDKNYGFSVRCIKD